MFKVVGMLAAIALTALCWGAYGPVLHLAHPGKPQLADSLKSFMCVGLAYFAIAIVIPVVLLARGERGGWTAKGVLWSMLAGTAGALGALGVLLALNGFGGKPIYVMPLVFGGAPVVNTLLTAFMNRSFDQLKAPFLAGLLLVITGAVTVLVFRPTAQPQAAAGAAAVAGHAEAGKAEPVQAESGKTESGKAEQVAATVVQTTERWIERLLAIALALFSWGAYGPVLHRGQAAMGGSRLRPLICIGAAYFLVAVLVPLAILAPMGRIAGWEVGSTMWSLAAGSLGALGALGTILAFTLGGKPFTVMPVVFGCAPVINTLTTLSLAHTPTTAITPFFLAGMLVVAVGAATVLVFGPRGHAAPPKPA